MKRVALFSRADNTRARKWTKRIALHLETHGIARDDISPDLVIALGGDGTILEASRRYRKESPLILGLNLGHVGFLASVRDEKDFLRAIDEVLTGKYHTTTRMLLRARVERNGKPVHELECLNEIAVQGILSSIKLSALLEDHPLQFVHGSGLIVSTPTGSTAYNLSAHGPIVSPEIGCMIVTELLDHHLPTPSILVEDHKRLEIVVDEVRARGLFTLSATGEAVDAVVCGDDMDPFKLEEGDRIIVTRSPHTAHFVLLEKEYFLKSVQRKFAFK